MSRVLGGLVAAVCSVSFFCAASANAQSLAPEFLAAYSLDVLGSPEGVAGNYGGLVIKSGDDNTLLLGGAANGAGGTIEQVSLTRTLLNGRNRITGFTGTAPTLSTAPDIDGGLLYAPNGTILYTGYNENYIGQIKPGSTAPDKISTLVGSVQGSVGAMQLIPSGFGANSGKLLLGSYISSLYYTADLVEDGLGTYNITNISASLLSLPGTGPEGIIYVPVGSPGFTNPSVLISEYDSGRVSAYDVDANGIPIAATRRDFVTGLSGAEGATIDALTGDLLFSTFGSGNDVVAVRGFATVTTVVPEAGSGVLAVLPLLIGAAAIVVRRRK
ncbi:MAG: hypothetical protein H7Y38_18235 [Armatimonadetes bacterium]|nr:hypothetical protein [Armatimonadota bacterium]